MVALRKLSRSSRSAEDDARPEEINNAVNISKHDGINARVAVSTNHMVDASKQFHVVGTRRVIGGRKLPMACIFKNEHGSFLSEASGESLQHFFADNASDRKLV